MIKTFNLIGAIDFNGNIGYQGKIPWYIKEELQYFKQVTGNNPIIMGRKTGDSLPKKPLPNRENLVISCKNKDYFSCLDTSLDYCWFKNETPFVIGGGSIYEQAITHPNLNLIYLTVVHGCYKGDVKFPEIPDCFKISSSKTHENFSTFILKRENNEN
jgi:dihydrofolate reductase